jgi:phosphate transport system permease protein
MTGFDAKTFDTVPDDDMVRSRPPFEQRFDQVFAGVTWVAAAAIAGILVLITLLLVFRAAPALQTFGLQFLRTSAWNPVTGRETYGVLPMLYGTLATSAIALLLAVPLGVGTAIFFTENFLPVSLRTMLGFLVDLLAAIPSVIYGLWGIFVVIPAMKVVGLWLYEHFQTVPLFSTPPIGPGLLPAGVVLAIMILPIITALSRESLAALPPDYREAALGLGTTRWGTLLRVLLPAAFPGIMGGIMLALGRAMGETMAVTMIIGNSNELKLSLLAPSNTIASLLASQFAEARGLQISALMYAALILMVITLAVNMAAQGIINWVKARHS